MKAGDVVFLDTNILLTATDSGRARHDEAQTLIESAAGHGVHLAVSGQILREYMVVATRRPESNGLGLAASEAAAALQDGTAAGSNA